MRLKQPELKRARIEIIPMIDTIFFLLVFFMIASLAMTRMQGMPVNLPKAQSASRATLTKFVVTITANHHYYIDKTPVLSIDAIENLCHAKLTANPKAVAIINADKNIRHGDVIAVMDAVKRAGAERMAIATEPLKKP